MGICNSKKKGDGGALRATQIVSSISELSVGKGMFILSNDGKFKEKYSLGQLLGQGAFGEVRKCINRNTKAIRAVKLIKKESMNQEEETSFKYEINILK